MIVGLTGGIGSGKTTIADIFQQEFGIDIIDADVVAREVVEPNTEGLLAIIDHFGAAILTPQGTLDRAKLRQEIFTDQKQKQWLNNLLHPLIRKRIDLLLSQTTSPYTLLVVPLLIESGWQKNIDRLLVVDVLPETQIQRTTQRDQVPIEQVKAILASQATREQRLLYADDIIDNNLQLNSESRLQLLSQVAELHKKYLTLSH